MFRPTLEIHTLVCWEAPHANPSLSENANLEGTSDHEAIIGPVNAPSNTVSIDTSVKGEFYGCGIDDANDVSTSWGLDDSEEWTVQTVFCVQLHHLLVVIGALQQFDSEMLGFRQMRRAKKLRVCVRKHWLNFVGREKAVRGIIIPRHRTTLRQVVKIGRNWICQINVVLKKLVPRSG